MKIIQVVGWYFPDSSGGTEVYVNELSKRLIADGHDVIIAAPHVQSDVERNYVYDGVNVYRYPILKKFTRRDVEKKVFPGTEHFHAWLLKQRPDVVHFHTFKVGLDLEEVKVAKRCGARVMVTSHLPATAFICRRGTLMRWGRYLCDGICELSKCASCVLQDRGLPKLLAMLLGSIPLSLSKISLRISGGLGTILGSKYLVKLDKDKQLKLYELCDEFIVLTEAYKEVALLNNCPSDKLVLNRLGISKTKQELAYIFNNKKNNVPIKIGYMGRLAYTKGYHILAKAIRRLPKEVNVIIEFRSPIISEQDKMAIKEIKDITGNNERVIFAESVSSDKVYECLANYDVICCPSTCFEGGPTIALEAFLVGTPVIGARIGGLSEYIENDINGRLFAPYDYRELARIIQEIAADPTNTIDRWRRGIKPIRSMDQVTEDYLKIYMSGDKISQ